MLRETADGFSLTKVADLKITLRLAAHILLGDILSLVVEFFTFCKSDLYFHKASLEINFHRDKRIALLCNLADLCIRSFFGLSGSLLKILPFS